MNVSRIAVLARLELLQRVRSVAWYVLLGVFALLLLIATILTTMAVPSSDGSGMAVAAIVINLTLLLVLLVSPTLSGNSINGDRDTATLAPVQVTLATTREILAAKFFAGWITGLIFALVSAPFLAFAILSGGVDIGVLVTALIILVVETGIIAGIGVALSGILARPLFSVASTYLVVAALTIGSGIAFGLGGTALATEQTYRSHVITWDDSSGMPECRDGRVDCQEDPTQWMCEEQVSVSRVARLDRVWWLLAVNPFVILADATPTRFDNGEEWPSDLFGSVKVMVRQAQIPPEPVEEWDECALNQGYAEDSPTPREILASTVPSWFVGLGLQVLLTAGLLGWAYARTRTPARTLPPGTRIA